MDEPRTNVQCSDILDCSEAEKEVSMAEAAAHSISEDVAPAAAVYRRHGELAQQARWWICGVAPMTIRDA
jgi:hypothetical protein